jgi:hypothetical protein
MSNMTGLYYLPLATIASEIGRPLEGASKGLQRLEEVGDAYYDQASQVVWVPDMAHDQVGSLLKFNDHKRKGILNQLEPFRGHRFFGEFMDKYAEAYNLTQAPSKPLRSPSKAPSKPLGRGSKAPSNSDPDPAPDPDPEAGAEAGADTHTLPLPPSRGGRACVSPSAAPGSSGTGTGEKKIQELPKGARRLLEVHASLLGRIRGVAKPRLNPDGAKKAWDVLCDRSEAEQDLLLERFVLDDDRSLVHAGHPIDWFPQRLNGYLSQVPRASVPPDPRNIGKDAWAAEEARLAALKEGAR